MDETTAQMAFGAIIGIVFIWLGIIVWLASRPLVRGEAQARTYNYRPWQPKFVKRLSDEEANALGKRFARYGTYLGWSMMLIGVVSMVLGLAGLGGYVLYLINLFVVLMFITIIASYAVTYKVSKGKAGGR